MELAGESLSQAWTVPTVTARSVLAAPPATLLDLRSPSEFAADHLPGATHAPLFDDGERALIGTLYHRHSPHSAFEEGVRLAEARIARLADELAGAAGRELAVADPAAWVRSLSAGGLAATSRRLQARPVVGDQAPSLVLYCARGGMRSSSIAAFCRAALDWSDACVLEGGYKAYRSSVLAELDAWRAPATLVLRGWTGVGKTLVLRELERLRPGTTLDLEACAAHRSSVLGMVGLRPRSQRAFDSHLAASLRRLTGSSVVVEGESRKVGDAIIPQSVWMAMQAGVNVRLTAGLERRQEVLIEDYLSSTQSREQLREQLPFIEGRLGPKKWGGVLVDLLDAGREGELVEVLLTRYYDPLYRHSEEGRAVAFQVDATDPARAAGELAGWLDERGPC
ncbi:MAG: tRNA 2-selenouridine(34) synthase MnmH [Planctomycetota bacterium]|jgi:tRNA 2-selenouridine synthase|nr:tRNA 2-selenouridine(34) synthase MnmH [Planctomycetota bacterium]MDP6762731.1 tRNA 2-selenouridine(34) synthase MnmH [Planctomycetota bacterium]MDP6988543.1 tRNA 2-selenouridine(34) synthase MnmH [Planctomycetota bacterium]